MSLCLRNNYVELLRHLKTGRADQNGRRDSAVFEELIHTAQFRNGEIREYPIDAIKAEINAKTKLLKYAKQYELTEKEIDTTRQLLLKDKEELKRLEEQDGI